MTAAGRRDKTKAPQINRNKSYYTRLEKEWRKYEKDDDSYLAALKFLKYRQNVERSCLVISNPQRLQEIALTLHRYRLHAKVS